MKKGIQYNTVVLLAFVFQIAVAQKPNGSNGLWTIDISRDDKYIATGGDDSLLRIFTADLKIYKSVRTGNKGMIRAVSWKMKEKGIQLKFDKSEYKNDILVHLEGSTKFKDQSNNFSVTDFSKFIVTKVKNGEHIFIQIRVDKGKQVS